jgi:tellurite resistance protein
MCGAAAGWVGWPVVGFCIGSIWCVCTERWQQVFGMDILVAPNFMDRAHRHAGASVRRGVGHADFESINIFIAMVKFDISLRPLLLACAVVAVGCGSVAKSHHSRLERVYRTHDEIAEISKKLQDIEQIMLYVGRINGGPLANAALDIAIAIHGEPDATEKKYAENITAAEIETLGKYAMELVGKRTYLETISAREKSKLLDEAYSIHGMESRYKLLETITNGCAMALCVAVAFFLLKKFF